MIINKIAIEPSSITSWESFRYVMEKLGFSKGLLLAKFPKSWPKMLLDSLDVGDIERQRIVTKLKNYKNDRMIPSGIEYNPDAEWVENFINVHELIDIKKVMVSDFISITDCDVSTQREADSEFFDCPREVNILNTSNNLSDIADVLVSNSVVLILVDPYLNIYSGNSYVETISKFVSIASNSDKCKKIIIYTKNDFIPRARHKELDRVFNEKILPISNSGLEICVKYVDDSMSKHPLHARYLLTEKGGMRYDKGFKPGKPAVHMDISLLDKMMHQTLYARFSELDHDYEIELDYTWKATK